MSTRETTETAPRVRPAFHHVTLKTGRMAEMIEWYGLVIGLRPTFAGDVGTWLTNDAANHRIALLFHPDLRDDPDRLLHAGLHHSAFEFDRLEDLLDNYDRLAGVGVLPPVCLDHGMTLSFYYADPDGNLLELQADTFGDWDASTRFMGSDEFAANPIGVPVDPARLVADFRAGVDVAELHRRAYYDAAFVPAGEPDLRLPPPPG